MDAPENGAHTLFSDFQIWLENAISLMFTVVLLDSINFVLEVNKNSILCQHWEKSNVAVYFPLSYLIFQEERHISEHIRKYSTGLLQETLYARLKMCIFKMCGNNIKASVVVLSVLSLLHRTYKVFNFPSSLKWFSKFQKLLWNGFLVF